MHVACRDNPASRAMRTPAARLDATRSAAPYLRPCGARAIHPRAIFCGGSIAAPSAANPCRAPRFGHEKPVAELLHAPIPPKPRADAPPNALFVGWAWRRNNAFTPQSPTDSASKQRSDRGVIRAALSALQLHRGGKVDGEGLTLENPTAHHYNSGKRREANGMETAWPYEFRERMSRFQGKRPPRPGEIAISIKLRSTSGCFHREHSPHAYEIIDQKMRSIKKGETEIVLQEHETGPEILAYVVLGLGLAKEIISLITALIEARTAGIESGDRANAPVHLIVRRVHENGEVRDEQALTIEHGENVDGTRLAENLNRAVSKLLTPPPEKPPRATKKKTRKKSKARKTRKTR